MAFRVTGLSPEPFRHLYGLSDDELAAHGAKRYIAGQEGGFPDRIEMRDAEPGEALLLLNHLYQPCGYALTAPATPFSCWKERSKPMIASTIFPMSCALRLLSLRAFDEEGMMLDGDVVEGRQIESVIERFFANPDVAYIHVHNAKRGCYSGGSIEPSQAVLRSDLPFGRAFSSLQSASTLAKDATGFSKSFQEGEMSQRIPGFNTLAVHAGAKPDPATGARATPIYQTTVLRLRRCRPCRLAVRPEGVRQHLHPHHEPDAGGARRADGRARRRHGGACRPRPAMRRRCWSSTRSCGRARISSPPASSMAARSTSSAMPSRISAGRCAGPTPTISRRFESQIDDKTRGIFIESLANPGGEFVDIEAIGDIARKHGLPLIVDNTLATPYLVRPIEHGADIVVHSLTKFIGGHGNSMGGVIVDGGTFDWSKSGNYPMLSEPRPEYGGVVLHETFGNFAFAIACRVLGLRDLGPAISPFNAFLILTGIETLPLRMQRHCDNALAVADWLSKHPKVAWVSYPGLPGDKNHALQKKYSPHGAGSVFTFGLKGGYDGRHQARRGARAVLASGQCRRHQIAGHPPGLDHAPPAFRRAEDRGRRRPGRRAAVGRHRGRQGHHRRPRTGAGQDLTAMQ